MGLDNPLHIAFLVVILLLVFGAKRLPEIGRSLGSGMREFKHGVTGETPAEKTVSQQPVAQQPVSQQPALSAAAQQQAAPVAGQPAAVANPAPVASQTGSVETDPVEPQP